MPIYYYILAFVYHRIYVVERASLFETSVTTSGLVVVNACKLREQPVDDIISSELKIIYIMLCIAIFLRALLTKNIS